MENKATLLSVGDIILDDPKAESLFDYVAPTLKAADVSIGHIEVLFTSRGVETGAEVIATPPCDPKNIRALHTAGFNVCTLAGNHVWDSGAPAIEDTIAGLKEYGIAYAGAGMNLEEAKRPAIIEKKGVRFGILNYNCVGPKTAFATENKAGCAAVPTITHYEMSASNPGAAPTNIYTFSEPAALKAMVEDIARLRKQCDVLAVCFHKGIVCIPVEIAMYEQQVSYAAIDAGADVVFGQHAHILKGIEMYKGKAIFHGLGNFVTIQRPPVMGGREASFREMALKGAEFFGYEADPDDYGWLFHPDGKKTIIAKCTVENGKLTKYSYLPCLIDREKRPAVLKHDEAGQKVFDYVEEITRKAGLNARFKWDGDEVLVYEGDEE